jgi:hypothetical protein
MKKLPSKPCNKCGRCCRSEVCPVGIAVGLPSQLPCPALDKLSLCGLITHPVKYIPDATGLNDEKKIWLSKYLKNKIMNFGFGCDSIFEEEQP